jgi:hypothetical protein
MTEEPPTTLAPSAQWNVRPRSAQLSTSPPLTEVPSSQPLQHPQQQQDSSSLQSLLQPSSQRELLFSSLPVTQSLYFPAVARTSPNESAVLPADNPPSSSPSNTSGRCVVRCCFLFFLFVFSFCVLQSSRCCFYLFIYLFICFFFVFSKI